MWGFRVGPLARRIAPGLVGATCLAWASSARALHAIALHGEPRYPRGFAHFDYVNPDAPKGGRLRQSMTGTFDNLNPFIARGAVAPVASTFDTLLVESDDEPDTAYGLLAREVELSSDGAFVDFELRSEATFHDGSRVTADDVAFSFRVLIERGHPRYRMKYAEVERVEVRAAGRVRFYRVEPTESLRGFALSLGELPVLSRRDVAQREFDRATLEPLLGSGPYRVARVEAGRTLALERVRNYWARALAPRVGQYNFDCSSYEYFRDSTASREALFADRVDARPEGEAQVWARAYQPEDVPAIARGFLVKERLSHQRMPSVQTFAFNLRRSPFDDWRIRRAIHLAFDFEWMNQRLFFGQYERTRSFFPAFGLAATGVPTGEERSVLERFAGQLPERVWSVPSLPVTDGGGYPRDNWLEALELLRQAGYVARDSRLVHRRTGEPFELEILLRFKGFERITLPFARNLRRLGIDARVRVIDSAHYQRRLMAFDFDMLAHFMMPNASPGGELVAELSSESAGVPGTRNRAGVANPVVDELIELVRSADDRQSLQARVRALDRVLLAEDYFIPQWHAPDDRIVYWDRYSHPEQVPSGAFPMHSWWWDADKAARLQASVQQIARAERRSQWIALVVAALALSAWGGVRATRRRSPAVSGGLS